MVIVFVLVYLNKVLGNYSNCLLWQPDGTVVIIFFGQVFALTGIKAIDKTLAKNLKSIRGYFLVCGVVSNLVIHYYINDIIIIIV